MNKLTNDQLRRRLHACALAILALGLACALLVYLVADEAPPDAVGYVVVEGTAYPIAPNQSKRYNRDLERIGGKSAVLFDEIDRWFSARWRGKELGVTLAWISGAVAAGLFLFARWLPRD